MKIIVKRELNDYEAWKNVVSTGNEMRKEKGSKGGTVYRNAKNPNQVFLIFDWDDNKSYLDYFKLPEVAKGLSDTGTTEIIEVSESFNLEA